MKAPPPLELPAPDRKHGIDLLRMALAGGVLVFHYLFFGLRDQFHVPAGTDHLLWLRFGVAIFFVVSGYVIFFSMAGRTALQFAGARVLRLWPALVVAATCTWIGCAWLGASKQDDLAAWLSAVSLVPLSQHGSYLDNAYWSLTFELRFYAIVALAIAVGLRAHVVWIITGLGVLGVVESEMGLTALGAFLYPCAGLFGMGMALAWAERGQMTQGLAALLVNLWTASLGLRGEIYDPDYNRVVPGYIDSYSDVVLASLAIVVTALALIIFFARLPIASRLVKPVMLLGAASYPLYLLHQRLGYAALDHVLAADWSPASAFLLVTSVMLLAACCIAALIEPRLRIGLRWAMRTAGSLARRFGFFLAKNTHIPSSTLGAPIATTDQFK